MKHKYRILEKHYDDGSVWFMPQVGDWWNGWRYLCKSHPCPEVECQRLAYKTFEEANAYMRDFIERDKQNIVKPAELCSKFPTTTLCSKFPAITKIHDYHRD